jgi:hypothetical protein
LLVDIYSTERQGVDPVFFAVVPDSFMNRGSAGLPPHRAGLLADAHDDAETDTPLLAPNDRWSF